MKKLIDTLLMTVLNPYWWGLVGQNIKDFVCPKNRWLTNKIPRGWADKDTLIEITLKECLIHFFEEEKPLDRENDEIDTEREKNEFYDKLPQMYNAVKFRFPYFDDKIQDLLDQVDFSAVEDPKGKDKRLLDDIERLEEEYENLKSEVFLWIVTNRGAMWT